MDELLPLSVQRAGAWMTCMTPTGRIGAKGKIYQITDFLTQYKTELLFRD